MEFWFEFASTYSYPAAMRIEQDAAAAGVAIEWKPFLLGPLLNQQQGLTDSPFNAVPVKGRYMWRDLERICDRQGLALNLPSIFPQNGLRAARLVLALPPEARPEFVRAVYLANFAEGSDISSEATLSRILLRLGHDPDALADRAASETVKQDLKDNTARAAALGIFGSPSFVTDDGELFWGNDRLDFALDWASGKTQLKTIQEVEAP